MLALLAPLVLLILIGVLLHRWGLMPAEFVAGLNRLLYWVALPVTVFVSLVTAEATPHNPSGLMVAMVLCAIFGAVVGWVLAPWCGVKSAARGTFTQAFFRGNLAFIALPLLLAVPGVPRADAVLALAPMIIAYNVLSVLVLLLGRETLTVAALGRIAGEIGRNPIIISSVAGAVMHALGWTLATPILRTLQALGQMTLPLALLCVGAALLLNREAGARRQAWFAAAGKTLICPLIGWGVASLMGLSQAHVLIIMICLACPTAAISYPMARQFGGDGALASNGVFFSSLLALPAMVLVLACFARF